MRGRRADEARAQLTRNHGRVVVARACVRVRQQREGHRRASDETWHRRRAMGDGKACSRARGVGRWHHSPLLTRKLLHAAAEETCQATSAAHTNHMFFVIGAIVASQESEGKFTSTFSKSHPLLEIRRFKSFSH